MALMFREPPSPPQGAPEWMVTYADMVTLLLTFFVMLASFSEINREGSYQELVESVQGRFGLNTAPIKAGELRPRNSALAAAIVGARALRDNSLQAGDPSRGPSSRADRALLTSIPCDPARETLPETAREGLADVATRTTGKSGTIEIASLAPRDQLDRAIRRAQLAQMQLEAIGLDPRRMKIAIAEEANGEQTASINLYLVETPSSNEAASR